MMGSGWQGTVMGLESRSGLTDQFMKDSGFRIGAAVPENSCTLMEIFTRESGRTTRRTEEVHTSISMAPNTPETYIKFLYLQSGSTTSSMAWGSKPGLITLVTKASTETARRKAKAALTSQTVPGTKENFEKMKSKATGFTSGRTDECSKVTGNKTKCTEQARSLGLTDANSPG